MATRLKRERLDLGMEYLDLLAITVSHFEAANGLVDVQALEADHVRAAMRHLMSLGRAVETVNANRRRLLLLWQWAKDFGWGAPAVPRHEVRRLKGLSRRPMAWQEHEMAALLAACDRMRPSKWWGPQHDRALVMAIYDTSTRVGALLKSRVSQIDVRGCSLFVPGGIQKGRTDTYQPIHADTLRMLLNLDRPPGDERLFPIPFKRRYFFVRFGNLLKLAGLPATRRDKTHRIRRTSYTLVAARFGKEAASEHAAHKTDMSRHYLDTRFLDRPNPLDALPRPRTA